MSTRKPPFNQLWTRRWWRLSITDSEAATWHQELTGSGNTWHRLVLMHWQDEQIPNQAHVLRVSAHIARHAHAHMFVSPRGVHLHPNSGVQVWCVNDQVPMWLNLTSEHIIRTRTFDPEQFSSHVHQMLEWKRKHYP